MLTVCTWLWGKKYDEGYVLKLANGLRRHLKQPWRLLVNSDREINVRGVESLPIPSQDIALLDHKGCFARLRMFDPAWQRLAAIHDRLVSVDLDVIATGPLDVLFESQQPFLILQGANAANPCPFNGSLMMLRVGQHQEVWQDFSIEAARKIPFYEFPDDQGWIWHKLPKAAGWRAGADSGVYAFKKPGWPKGDELPAGARLVAFPGWRDPAAFGKLDWVKANWQ